MAFTIITVTGTYRNVDLSPAQGTVSFRASDEMANGGNIQEPTVTVGILDVNGHMSVTLPAVDDAGTMPAGVTYEVFEAIHGAPERAWNFSLGHTINPYDISLAAPALSPTAAYNYALDVNLVHNAGNETIGGVKTFTSAPIVPSNSFPESAITNLVADLAAKALDSAVVHLAGTETLSGQKIASGGITGLPVPVAASDAATKSYADGLIQGLSVKTSVKAASSSNVASLSGPKTIDSYSAVAGDRVLLFGQSTASQNGIWVVQSGAWTRPTDFATGSEAAGAFTFVEGGTVNGGSGYTVATVPPVTVDSTAQSWTQFSGAGEIIAGTGLSKSGNTLFNGGVLSTAATDATIVQSGSAQNPTFAVGAIAESQVTSLVSDLALKATDSLAVHLAGTETITGSKNFTAALQTGGSTRLGTDGSLQNIKSLTFGGGGPYNVGAGSVSDIINLAFGNMRVVVGGVAGGSTPNLTAEQALLTVTPFANEVVTTGFTTQRFSVFSQPSLNINSGQTVANAATLAVAGAPTNSGSGTLTNPYAIWGQAGLSRLATLLVDNGLTVTAGSVTLPAGSIADGALASTFVHLGGTVNESITGIKTFNSAPVVPSNSFPESAITNLTTDLAAKATDSLVVHLAGIETITGAKTLSALVTANAGVTVSGGPIALTGITGATTPNRWVGGTQSGPPTSGVFSVGDWTPDQTGKEWICSGYVYPTYVKTAGAQTLWMLNETGGTVTDLIGGLVGTLNGGVTTGVAGPNTDNQTAMAFNGTTGYIDCGTTPLAAYNEPFSAGVIAKEPSSSGNRVLFGACQTGTNLQDNFMFQLTGHGVMRFQLGSQAVAYTGGVDDGLWHHWVGTYDGQSAGGTNSVQLFRDGVLVASAIGPSQAGIVTTSVVTAIGRANAFSGRYYDGTVADAFILKGSQLTPAAIKSLYLQGAATFPYSFTSAALATSRYPIYNVKDYGAKGDGRVLYDGAITTGTAIFTSATAAFTQADVTAQREVCVQGAGAAGASYRGTILSLNSATSVNLDLNAGTTVSGAFSTVGTDDTYAIQKTIDAATAAGGGYVYRPATVAGIYLCNSTAARAKPVVTGRACLFVMGSNLHFTSDGPQATLLQGPCGVDTVTTKLWSVLGPLSKVGQIAGTEYPFNAGLRGDPTVTTTTAADAGNFAVDDVIYIRSEPARGSGDWAEANIVTSVNAGTGVIGLKWQMGKDYPLTGAYGVSKATGQLFSNISFEHEWHVAIDRYMTPGAIFGLRMVDLHLTAIPRPARGAGNTTATISPGYVYDWEIRNSEFTYNDQLCQWDTGCDRNIIVNNRFIQESCVTGTTGINLTFSENQANILIQGNLMQSSGATDGTGTILQIVEVWGCQVLDNFIQMDTTATHGHAIDNPGSATNTKELVIRGNHIWGLTVIKSPETTFDSNTVYYTGANQAIIGQSVSSGSIRNNTIYLARNANTGIYPAGSHDWLVENNRVIGDGTAGQKAFYLPDDAGTTKSAHISGNYAKNCAIGLEIANPAHEPGLYLGPNDFSGCTVPYQVDLAGGLPTFQAPPTTLTTLATYSPQYFNYFPIPTITATTSKTVADAETVTIAGPPAAAGSAIITTGYALRVLAGTTRLDGLLQMGAAASQIAPGATSLSLRNNANNADNLLVADAGDLTARTKLTMPGPLVLTSAASKIIPGATNISLRNNADSADNLLMTDAGLATFRNTLTVSAGGLTVSAGAISLPAASIADAALSSNVGLLTGTQTFSGVKTFSGDLKFGSGLISTASGAPASSALGANVTSATATGNNRRGTIAVVMAGALAANTKIATFTFASSYAYPLAPFVFLFDQTSGAGLGVVNFYYTSTTTTFDLFCDQALALGTYTIGYLIEG